MKQKQPKKHKGSRPSPAAKQQEEAVGALLRAMKDKDPIWAKQNMLSVAREATDALGWNMSPRVFLRLAKRALIMPAPRDDDPAQRLIDRFGGEYA